MMSWAQVQHIIALCFRRGLLPLAKLVAMITQYPRLELAMSSEYQTAYAMAAQHWAFGCQGAISVKCQPMVWI